MALRKQPIRGKRQRPGGTPMPMRTRRILGSFRPVLNFLTLRALCVRCNSRFACSSSSGKRSSPKIASTCGSVDSRGGIIGVAEVAEAPRIQPEPAEQLPFIRETEKFAGDQLRVKLRMLKRIEPVISRKYLLSWPELAGLSILRCARGTHFRVTHEQAAALQKIVEGFQSFPNG